MVPQLGIPDDSRRPSGDLDDVLGLEESFQRAGAAQAEAAGAEAGTADGRALGWSAGAALAAELSFCAGVSAALAALDLPPRARAAAAQLRAAVGALRVAETGNDEQADFERHLATVRDRCRAALATAGLHRVRFDADKPTPLTDYSF
jgi:hypothetical protein